MVKLAAGVGAELSRTTKLVSSLDTAANLLDLIQEVAASTRSDTFALKAATAVGRHGPNNSVSSSNMCGE